MSFHQIVFAPESAWDIMNNLAHNEHAMLYHAPNTKFKANSPMTQYAHTVIKRCEESFEQLAKIESKIEEYEMPLMKFTRSPNEYIHQVDAICRQKGVLGNRLFEETEKETSHKFSTLNNQLQNLQQLTDKRLFLFEKRNAYQVMDDVINFDERPSETNLNPPSMVRTISDSEDMNRMTRLEKRFNVLLGIVPTENSLHLYKLVFRLAKENVMIRMRTLSEVSDSYVNSESRKHPKTLMFLLFQRGEANIIYDKIKHILTQFEFVELDIPNSSKRTEMMFEIYNELEENQKLLASTLNEVKLILKGFCAPSEVPDLSYLYYLKLVLKREQNFALNYRYLEQKDGFYQLQLFLPKALVPALNSELAAIRPNDPNFTKPKVIEVSSKDPKYPPVEPTLFKLNQYIVPFQTLVSTYGIPRYKEINPAVFTVVSFPFFFGLMFGDFGHGALLFLTGLYLMYSSRESLRSFSSMLILMGFFSTYCGLIYNEFFSVPMPLMGSCYDIEKRIRTNGCTYSFGVDWMWGISRNETQFVNSFKMKFSIIIGVIQMLLGSLLKGLNGFYFSNYLDLFCEAIPQFLLMAVTFGYMSFCIAVKWMTDWTGKENKAVSIIQLFINFHRVEYPLFGPEGFQESLQITFIIVAIVCVFVMLLVKPIVLSNTHRPPHKKSVHSLLKEDETDPEHLLINQDEEHAPGAEEPPESFRDLMMHQMIETIEYVLGIISNTASYLRLWALSLAHGQLSRVFLGMIFGNAIAEGESAFGLSFRIILGFMFFLIVTLAIILLMDTMECFLHALRLHWVEFQNKFFKGDGIDYVPFKHVY